MKITDLGFDAHDIVSGKEIVIPDGFLLSEPMTEQAIAEDVWLTFHDTSRYQVSDTVDENADLIGLPLQYMLGLAIIKVLKESHSGNFEALDIIEKKRYWYKANNALSWIMNNMDPAMAIALGRLMISVHKLPWKSSEIPAWDEYAGHFKSIIMNCNELVSKEFKDHHMERINAQRATL